jgi:RNA polymerase sigma-70 factor (ECF subfamily)
MRDSNKEPGELPGPVRASFSTLYEQYLEKVFTYCQYRCDSARTAEDLAEQVFERVLRCLPNYDSAQAPFAAWLFAIARHVVTDWQRRQYVRSFLPWERFLRHPSREAGPEQAAVENEERRELHRALAQLSARERDLLGLRYASRLTNREIAALTGFGESKVAVTIFRAIKKLRTVLEESEVQAECVVPKSEVKYE